MTRAEDGNTDKVFLCKGLLSALNTFSKCSALESGQYFDCRELEDGWDLR